MSVLREVGQVFLVVSSRVRFLEIGDEVVVEIIHFAWFPDEAGPLAASVWTHGKGQQVPQSRVPFTQDMESAHFLGPLKEWVKWTLNQDVQVQVHGLVKFVENTWFENGQLWPAAVFPSFRGESDIRDRFRDDLRVQPFRVVCKADKAKWE